MEDLPARTIQFADGSTISMRPMGVRDGRLVSSFLTQLSSESEYKRFMSPVGAIRSRWVAGLINANSSGSLAYGACAVDRFGSSLVAIGESIRLEGDRERAEFALAAIDPWQNMGIGSLLSRFLAEVALSRGVRFWESYMLADNRQMARLLAGVGRRVELVIDSGVSSAVYELGTSSVLA
jgi:GNAT superfamily N-acetyltransferase